MIERRQRALRRRWDLDLTIEDVFYGLTGLYTVTVGGSGGSTDGRGMSR